MLDGFEQHPVNQAVPSSSGCEANVTAALAELHAVMSPSRAARDREMLAELARHRSGRGLSFWSLGSGYPSPLLHGREVMEDEQAQLSFERDVRPLFRERDRGAMLEVAKFDLWMRDDVAEHSQAILERVENGSMPCDQAWPTEQVALFRRWVDSGMPA